MSGRSICKGTQQREMWADVMKGMLIISVVYYHVVNNPVLMDLKPFYVSYFMASFFFISGYFHKMDDSVMAVVKKKTRELLLPLALIAFPCMVLRRLFCSESYDMDTILIYPFKYYFLLSELWFLNCLFCGHVILAFFTLIYKRLSDWSVLLFWPISLAVMLYVNQNREDHLFFEFQTAIVMQLFMIAGFLFKQHNWMNYVTREKYVLIFICIYIVMMTLFYNEAGAFDVHLNNYGKIWLYLPLSLLGTFIVAGLSAKLNKSRILVHLGRKSLIIYMFHVPISLYIKSVLFLIVQKCDDINVGALRSLVDYSACCGSLVISFLIACFLDRYCPLLLGKQRRARKNDNPTLCQ